MKELSIKDGKITEEEGPKLEFKTALKGISGSTWESYSAFANTFGGTIIHGINNETHEIEGVPNAELRLQEIWNTLNNPQVVNRNILHSDDVRIEEVDGKKLIVMDVPRAEYCLRPIYYRALETGTYKRNGEGDYRCNMSEIASMLRDQSTTTYDFTILDNTSFDDIDIDTFHSFRNMMKVSTPDHIWNKANDLEFAKMIGVIGRSGDETKLTVAGLLMFGKEYVIYSYFPAFKLDYQEFSSGWPNWNYRFVTGDGNWEGNIFNFFSRAGSRLTMDLPCPLEIGADMRRIVDTDAHRAVRECFLNAIVNADYLSDYGVTVQKYPDHIRVMNSGLFRVPLEVAEKGGMSNPRNNLIARMFSLLKLIERSGIGVNFIFQVWGKAFGNRPEVQEDVGTQTVTFDLFLRTMNKTNSLDGSIIEAIRANPKVTTEQIAKLLSVSSSTVTKHIHLLRDNRKIERVGGTRGYWKVLD